jgi:hypothetical protein
VIPGLALIAVGAALSQISVAEPLTRSGEQATPSKPSLFFGKARQRAKANPAQEVAASRARAADTSCASPWTYSRGLRRCACTRDGYSLQSGDCLLDAATSCGDNEHWSPKRSACVCAEGLKRIGGTCAPDEIVTAVTDPLTTLPATPVGLSDEQVQAISRAQRCLTELGYYKGPIDGKRGKDTWTAYWNFKHDNGLSGQKDLLSERVQQKMTELCKGLDRPTAIAAEPPPQAELAPVPVAPVAEEATPTPPARLDIDCLPDDLLATLRRAHGQAVTAERCQDTCLPTPSGLPQSHLDDLQRRQQLLAEQVGAAAIIGERCHRLDGRQVAHEAAEVGLERPEGRDHRPRHAELLLDALEQRPVINSKVEIRSGNLADIAGHIVASCESSLKRLGIDHLDCLQIHNGPLAVAPALEGGSYRHLALQDFLRPGGALEGLHRLKAAGKINYAGFICRGGDGNEVRELLKTGQFHLINVPYTLINPTAGLARPSTATAQPDYGDVINDAGKLGVGCAVFSPLAGGFLTDDRLNGATSHPLARPHDPLSDKARQTIEMAKAVRFLR